MQFKSYKHNSWIQISENSTVPFWKKEVKYLGFDYHNKAINE